MDDKKIERSIYWSSFIVRCLLGLAAVWISQHTTLSLIEDAAYYAETGAKISSEWLSEGSSTTLNTAMESDRQAWGMVLIIAILSVLVGGVKNISVLIILYTFITALTPVITYKIARRLGILPKAALNGAQLIMFSPVFAFWAGSLYKEGVVLLTLNLIVYHILILQKKYVVQSIIYIALSIFVLLSLRFYLAALLLPIILLGVLLVRANDETRVRKQNWANFLFHLITRQGLSITFLVAALIFFGFNNRIIHLLPDSINDFFYALQLSRDDLVESGAASGYLRDIDISVPQSAIIFLPRGILYFLTVPFPWQLGPFRQNLVIPEMIFWLWQYPFIFLGMKRGLQRNFQGSFVLIAVTVLMLCFYGALVGNAGTAYRLRSQIWLFWAIFAGWYGEKKIMARYRKNQIASLNSA